MTRKKYPEQPCVIPMKKDRYGNTYYLHDNYVYSDDQIELLVFKNFRYDGASVPRLVWTLSGLTPDGLIRAAALVHDIIYLQDGLPSKINPVAYYKIRFKKKLIFTRKDADKIFLKIMIESGVAKWRAKLAYRFVRIGGRFYRNF